MVPSTIYINSVECGSKKETKMKTIKPQLEFIYLSKIFMHVKYDGPQTTFIVYEKYFQLPI